MLRERPSKGENRSSRNFRPGLKIWRTEGPKIAAGTQQAKVAAPLVLVEHSENEEKGSDV